MRIEQAITAAWASRLARTAIEDAIGDLKRMDFEDMLSGDSGLEDVWEEICVQVQEEQSVFWHAYEQTIDCLLDGYIDALDRNARLALWSITDEGWDWIDEHHADDDGEREAPVDVGEIVAKLKEELLSAAADHKSPSTRRFFSTLPTRGGRDRKRCKNE